MLERLNKFECPTCQKPLNEADSAWAMASINNAMSRDGLTMRDNPRELSCGHKANVEAAQFQSGSGLMYPSTFKVTTEECHKGEHSTCPRWLLDLRQIVENGPEEICIEPCLCFCHKMFN